MDAKTFWTWYDRIRLTYGPERLQRDLAAHGVRVGVGRPSQNGLGRV
ncbi:MAG TPA: hypothetical protein PKY50_19965 [Candidatus Competibacter sp.]|nr:hypothetical protein [Candidatus Competibacter sp.]